MGGTFLKFRERERHTHTPMDFFFLEKCAKKPGERRTTTTDAASREFLETLDDDIMTAIATTTPLSAKDSMKLADRLIEVSQETMSRRERVFEERMEHMEKKNKMLEEKLVLMTTPQPTTTTTTTTNNNRNNDKGEKADVASPTSEGTDTGTNNTIENEEDAIQKTLFDNIKKRQHRRIILHRTRQGYLRYHSRRREAKRCAQTRASSRRRLAIAVDIRTTTTTTFMRVARRLEAQHLFPFATKKIS